MARMAGDDETIRKHSGWLIPLGVLVVTFLLSAMFLLLYLAPSAPSLFEEQVSPTSRTDRIHLTVHGHAFDIPANYLQYESARQGGARKEVALFALLPEMVGWSNWESQSFASNAPDSSVVFLLIRNESISLSETERLQRIYLGYVTNPRGTPGPYDLQQYEFNNDSGYRDEDLFVGRTASGPVVLRCVRGSGEVPSPSCMREMLLAPGVSLSYRFKRTHLSEWREIAAGVDRLIASFEKHR